MIIRILLKKKFNCVKENDVLKKYEDIADNSISYENQCGKIAKNTKKRF